MTAGDGTVASERGRIPRAIAYVWFETVMWATAPMPDFKVVQRLRGRLLAPCFKKCGKNFMIAKGVSAAFTTSIEVGNDVWIAKGSWLMGQGGIRLGDEAMLGPYTVLTSALHTKHDGSYRHGAMKASPVVLERGSWTGAHSVITAGVTVGEGALVAAGCTVTVDVPPGAKIAGVPGQVLKREPSSAGSGS